MIHSKILPALLLIVATSLSATPTEDGLYAVFETSRGTFTAELYYELAPLSCANFVGLAEGSLPSYEGEDFTPKYSHFYDDLTFHRVSAGFVIQGGDPDGNGTGGPGYRWLDEVRPELSHDAEGILSMANAGANTNGSQFFITLSDDSAPDLDGRHNVFGKVVESIGTVRTIGSVITDAEEKPTFPVTIDKVTILRIGDAANAFDPSFYANAFDPRVSFAPKAFETEIDITPTDSGTLAVTAPKVALADYRLLRADDPRAEADDWTEVARIYPSLDPELEIAFALPEIQPNAQKFYRIQPTIASLRDMFGIYENLVITSGTGENEYVESVAFLQDLVGVYESDTISESAIFYDWAEIGNGRAQLAVYNINFSLNIHFFLTPETETTGKVLIREYNPNGQIAFLVNGTYTLNPTE